MATATAKIDRNSEDFQDVTNQYAASVIESMKDDLDALHHAENCKRKGCKRGSETRKVKGSDGKTYTQAVHESPEAWHSEERARQAIEEGHYGVEVRSDWHRPGDTEDSGPIEYRVTLGGGGPASRIIGELGRWAKPETAVFQYQDWFRPWTDAQTTGEQDETMLEWVQQLYFGE
jgi:hypothetical protein